MKRILWVLILSTSMMLGVSGLCLADEVISNKIADAVKIQGTIVGKNLPSAAILDNLIAREGDVFLVDGETGHLTARLLEKEIDDYPANLRIKIIAISTGSVTLEYEGSNLTLMVGPRSW